MLVAAALGWVSVAAAPALALQDDSSAADGDPESGFVCELPDGAEAWPSLP